LEILLTPDNSNLALTRTKVDFPWISFMPAFTVILPLVTRTLDDSNLPLTRSNFCFTSDYFYTNLPSMTRTMFWARAKSEKKWWTTVQKSEALNLFQNFVVTFVQIQSVHPCEVCMMVAFPLHLFAYLLSSGYLLRTPNNSNFVRFP